MQKLIFIKRIIHLISILSFLLHILFIEFFRYKFNNNYVKVTLIIFLVSILIILILSLITAGYLGTPRNPINIKKLIDFNNDVINIVEIKKGIWQVKDNKYNSILDMSGWFKQKRYIYELLTTKLLLDEYNKGDQMAFSLPYGTQKTKLNNILFRFINLNGNTFDFVVVKNHVIRKTLYMRYRLRMSLKGTRGAPREEKNDKHYFLALDECFKLRISK